MNLHTAAPYLRQGYRIRRTIWENHPILFISEKNLVALYYFDDLVADDWELITEGIIQQFPITYLE
jgi:hypothetical protein